MADFHSTREVTGALRLWHFTNHTRTSKPKALSSPFSDQASKDREGITKSPISSDNPPFQNPASILQVWQRHYLERAYSEPGIEKRDRDDCGRAWALCLSV